MDASLVSVVYCQVERGVCDDPDPLYRGMLPSVCR
jgi:hypothetical protein